MKKLTIFVSILCLSISMMTGCGNKDTNTENSQVDESVSSSSVSEEEILTDEYSVIPENIIKNYEQADFDKYNSYASENGLGDTAIWVQGVFGNLETQNSEDYSWYITILTDLDKNEWLVCVDFPILMLDESDSEYKNLEDKDVVICGIYEGFSDVYNMPYMEATVIYDIFSEKTILTGHGQCMEESPEYNESYLQQISEKIENESEDEINMSELPSVNSDMIETGEYNGQTVLIENCVVDAVTKYECTLWIPAEDSYKSYEEIYYSTSDVPEETLAELQDGDTVTVLTPINDAGSWSGYSILDLEITGTADLNTVYDSYKSSCSPLDYDAVVRDAKSYYHDIWYVSGTIEYIDNESSFDADYVIRTSAGLVYVNYDREASPRFIEGDYITVYGWTDSALKSTYLSLAQVPSIWSKLIVLQ